MVMNQGVRLFRVYTVRMYRENSEAKLRYYHVFRIDCVYLYVFTFMSRAQHFLRDCMCAAQRGLRSGCASARAVQF